MEQRINDPWMGMGIYMLVTLVLGIVFLMTVKPAPYGSLLVIGVAVVLGLAASLPGWRNIRYVRENPEAFYGK